MYFCYFLIISPLKRHTCSPSFEQTWIPTTEGCFVPSLVEIGQVVLSKKIFKFYLSIFSISLLSPFEQTWISFTYGCFALGLVEIGTMVLERIFFNVYEQVVLEKKFLKIHQSIFSISLLSPLSFNIPSLVYALHYVWLKLAKWFWWEFSYISSMHMNRQRMGNSWSENLTWALSSCELK